MSEPIVMYESDEAATWKEGLSGWVSRTGHFFGKNEDMARWNGCTHKTCECGGVMSRSWTKCEACRDKTANERFLAMPSREWAGEPVMVFGTDTYFFSDDEVLEHVAEHGDDHMLVFCDPVYAPYIEEYGIDQLPDDWTIEDADAALAKLIDEVNKYVAANKPVLSWTQGKVRATFASNT